MRWLDMPRLGPKPSPIQCLSFFFLMIQIGGLQRIDAGGTRLAARLAGQGRQAAEGRRCVQTMASQEASPLPLRRCGWLRLLRPPPRLARRRPGGGGPGRRGKPAERCEERPQEGTDGVSTRPSPLHLRQGPAAAPTRLPAHKGAPPPPAPADSTTSLCSDNLPHRRPLARANKREAEERPPASTTNRSTSRKSQPPHPLHCRLLLFLLSSSSSSTRSSPSTRPSTRRTRTPQERQIEERLPCFERDVNSGERDDPGGYAKGDVGYSSIVVQ